MPIYYLIAVFTASPLAAQETLKLGALVTISGAGASWGQNMLRAAELAAEDIDFEGGGGRSHL